MSTLYSDGLMKRLGDALEKAGLTSGDVDALCRFGDLAALKSLLKGRAEITEVVHVVDCDADPFTPDGWKVDEHRKGGRLAWDPAKVRLYLSGSQLAGRGIQGDELRRELETMPVVNANVLDYLMRNPHLIPEDWKGKAVFFWGTVYRSADGRRNVRSLCWNGSRWDWGYFWFSNAWDSSNPALLLVSDSWLVP